VPGRPRGRTFDLILTPDHAAIRGLEELILPWSAHLDFVRSETSSEGWFIGGWGGKGAGVAVDLKGSLMVQSQALPLMRTWSARWASTPIGGGRAPLHRLTPFERRSDKDVVHALCTTLALRPELRSRLADAPSVNALLSRIAGTSHARGYPLEGVRRLTIETGNALRALGRVHPVGGRPLPDVKVLSAAELLPQVLERIHASPYAHEVAVEESAVLALIERGYSRWAPWPFEPIFD
jgi:hypothetical protein